MTHFIHFARPAAVLAVLAATLGYTTQVLAQEATYERPTPATSLNTRAAVQARNCAPHGLPELCKPARRISTSSPRSSPP
jgi:hypothetical protein